ncbi:MAG: methyltransferase domain-containing protein, partial [bacterium]|nr:methyltransferase domain-containing protein [bacterium]
KNNWIMEINHLFLHKTIKTLVEYLKPAGGRQDRQPKQDAVSGPVPKTPIHHWFFRQAFADKSHFNQWVMLSNDKGYDENILQIVFRALTDHHDGLRLRCRDVAGRMILENLSPGDNSFALSSFDMQSINTHTDGPHSQPEEHKGFQGEPPLGAPRVGAAGGTQAQQLHLAMDLEKGPLVQVGLFKFYSGHRLLISIHHLVMDGVSWRILLEDFQTAYTQAEGKAAIRLPAKSHSFQHWARAQRLFAKSSPLLKELPYWRQIPHSSPRETPFDSLREAAAGARTFADDAVVKMVLPAGLTGALLKKVNHAYNTRINDILLTALAGAVKSWCGVSQLTVNLEGHGREPIVEDIDNHRTIGWFTTQYPVHLVSPQGDDGVGSRLKTIKEILRRVPRNGIGYGILKHLTPAATLGGPRPDAHPHISFNYLGQFSIGEGTVMGDSISSNFEKPHALHVEGILIDNSLTIAFHYHKHEFKAETMERLRDFYREQLEDIIQHCSSRETTELTPSDLGYAALSLAAFDVIRKGINNNSEEDMKTEALYPMTPVQKAMFAASSANPRAYFVQNLLALPASVDTAVLEKSFNVLIKRHAVLRTVFKQAGDTGTPIQVVPDKGRLTVNEENLASLAAGEREERLKRLLKEDRERGFDLSVACPMRMTLVRTGETENTLIWTLHHILMDGWCFGLILNQWRDVYDALAAGQLPADVAPVPFRRYIDWLEQQDTGPGEAYWSQYLEHCRPTRFTSAADVKNKGTYQLEEHYFTLDSSLTAALNRTASGNRVTLYTLFQVLWGILLNSHTQNEDVLFGSVVSGRSDSVEGIEQIIGLLINLIPVRLRVNGLTTFPELLEEVQKQALQSRAHDRLPLADLLAAASLPPHSIDTIMIFENYQADSPPEAKADSIREKGLHSVRWLGNHEQWEYDFCVYVIPGPELTLRFSYNASVFTQAFVAQLADQFKQLAELANKATGVLTVSESGKPGKRKTGGMLYANTSIFYDLDPRQMMTEDIPFYLRYAQEQGGDILELACGTGRITMPLVEAGNSVWAVDLSKTMMARLEEKVKGLEPAAAQRIHTSIQNMATFSFNKKFPLIFISFRSFQAMHTEKQQLECLRNVYKHLADDGRFIISFLRPVEGMESRWINLEEVLSWENIEPRSGNKVRCYLIRTDIDPRRQMIYADQVYYIESADGNVERMVDNMALRYDYVDKIKMLLSSTGFKIEREMGHYDGRPLEEGIDYIFVCQKK